MPYLLPVVRAVALATAIAAGGPAATAQLRFRDPPMTLPPDNAISLCEADPAGEFVLRWEAESSLTGATATVSVPIGATYVQGSHRDVAASPAGVSSSVSAEPSVLTFALGDLPAGATGSIAFRLEYDCDILATFSSPHTLSLTADADQQSQPFTLGSAAVNATLAEPQLVLQPSPETDLTDVVLGRTYVRDFAIAQIGVGADLYRFDLCVDYGASVDAGTADLEGEILNFGGEECITLSTETYPDLPWPFSEGDSWAYTEDVRVTSCEELGTDVAVEFGCGGGDCGVRERRSLAITLVDDAPTTTLVTKARTLPADNCLAEGVLVETEWEVTGRLVAPRMRVIAANSDLTYVDPGTVEVNWGDGYVPYEGDYLEREFLPGCERNVFSSALTETQASDIDATDAPRTVGIRYLVRLCCNAEDGVADARTDLYANWSEVTYEDKCGQTACTQDGDQNLMLFRADGALSAPAYLADGARETFTVDVTEEASDDAFEATTWRCTRLTLDPALTPDLAAGVTLRADGQAAFRQPLSQVSPGVYEACFPQGQAYATGSVFEFDVEYACSEASAGRDVTSSFDLEAYVGRRGACAEADECSVTLFSARAETQLGDQCAAACATGLVHVGASAERSCFGLPDNDGDGCADITGALDFGVVRADRAIEGDEVTLRSRVEVIAPAGSGDITEIAVEVAAPTDHLPGSSGVLAVADGSGATYSCGAIAAEVVDARTLRYVTSVADLRACGTFPADFSFADGDELTFTSGLVVAGNSACGFSEVSLTPAWTMRTANSAAPVACNEPIPASYTHVGYQLAVDPRERGAYRCGGLFVDLAAELCVGGAAGTIAFPGEYRDYGNPRDAGIEVTPGLTLEQLELRYSVWPTGRGTQGGTTTPVDVTAWARVADGYVVMDWEAYFDDCDPEPLLGGAGWEYVLRAYFQGPCAVEDYHQRMYAGGDLTYCALPDTVRDLSDRRSFGRPFAQLAAALELRSSAPVVAPRDNRVTWEFTVRETAGAVAENAYVVFASPSGLVVPEEVRLGGTVVSPVSGVYRLGAVAASGLAEVQVTASFGDCAGDALTVLSGWDCAGYPATDAQVLAGNVLCASDSLTLGLRPGTAGIQQRIVEGPAERTTPCEDQVYELELLNTSNTAVFEPVLQLTVPFEEGIDLLEAAGALAYPSPENPADGEFDTSLGSPTRVERTGAGILISWDLADVVPEFATGSGSGWSGVNAEDANARRISAQIHFRTNCNFIGGDFLTFETRVTTYCGTEASTSLETASPIRYDGISVPYEISHRSNVPSLLQACGPRGVAALGGSLTVAGVTDGADSLVVTLPAGLRYVTLTADEDFLDAADVRVRRIGPIGARGVYLEEVTAPIRGGISPQDLGYEITVDVDPADLLCAEPTGLRVRSVRGVEVTCRGETCRALTTTGELTPAREVRLIANSFAIAEVALEVACGGTEVTLAGIAVTNAGEEELDHPIDVTLYRDEDGSGTVTAADVAIGSTSVRGRILSGETETLAGGVIAVDPGTDIGTLLARASGCACEFADAPAGAIRFDNAGEDTEVCADQPVSLGCADDLSDVGYAYAWSTLGDVPASSIEDPDRAATLVTSVNDGELPLRTAYVLTTTTPGGNSTTDTVVITVLPSCRRIGDLVWVDYDGDGLQSPGEPGLAGVTVELVDAFTPAAPIDFSVTDASGRFAFDDYPAGEYFLRFDVATSAFGEDYYFTSPRAGGNPRLDSDAEPTGFTAVFAYDPEVGPRADIDAGVRPTGRASAVLAAPRFLNPEGGSDIVAPLRLGIANLGEGDLEDLSVEFPVVAAFGAAFRGFAGAPNYVGGDVDAAPALNFDYDGEAVVELFDRGAGGRLGANRELVIEIPVAFDAAAADFPVSLQAAFSGAAAWPDGGRVPNSLRSADLSDGGFDYEGTNPGAPGELGTEDDPVLITCASAGVRLALDGDVACVGSASSLRLTQPFGEEARYEWRAMRGDGAVFSTEPRPDLSATSGSYVLRVRVSGADSLCFYDLTDEIAIASPVLPQGFSPNGDGVNDTWDLPCIPGFGGARIEVYNRWGNRVYENDEYRASWGGRFDASDLPDGTYYYLILPEAGGEPLSGWVQLMR